jgi:hypothetical protein
MHDCCAAANLPPVFCDGSLPEAVQETWPAFQHAFRERNRGTRLNDILAFGKSAAFQVSVAAKRPNRHDPALLMAVGHLNARIAGYFCAMYFPMSGSSSHTDMQACTSLRIKGVDFKPFGARVPPPT